MGTESALDRSKSIKTFLMTLFSEHGNYDIEVGNYASLDMLTTLAFPSQQRAYVLLKPSRSCPPI